MSQEAKKNAIRLYRTGAMREALSEAIKAADSDLRDTAIHNLAGAIALEIGDPGKAITYLSRSLETDRHQAAAQYLIGNAFTALSLPDQAVDAYKASLAIDAKQPDALANLGIAYRSLQRFTEAERNLRMALELSPGHPEANNALAIVLDGKTQPDRAEPFARRAIQADHSKAQYAITYGTVLRHLRRFADAQQVYEAALQFKPNDPELLCSLGNVLREQNLFDTATEHYEQALHLAPRSRTVLRNAADYFRSVRENEKARKAYEKLISVVGNEDVGAFNNLAIILRDMDCFDDAEEMYLKCIELDDDNAYGYNNLAILQMEMGKGKESIEYYKKALEQNPNYRGARSNLLFYMNYLSEYSPEELFVAHRDWQNFHVIPPIDGSIYHPNDPDPERKLKIGLVSADFFGHAVSYFIEAYLKHHDRENFEITCYAHVPTPDAITERLQGYVDTFRYIHQLKNNELADMIRDDRIDILVDLAGHTAGNRLDAVAEKPAPVQVTWIGYPNTTGLDNVDYRLVDPITDPKGLADRTHSETLWRLPRCFTCYNPQSNEAVANDPPVAKNGYITFGSFNNASKISSKTVESWSAILHAIPDSKLVLKSASLADVGTQERFRQRFAEHGIDISRIEMLGRLPSAQHMLMYNEIDIGLDPTPYNGTTTSCEALWMGVPIVTLAGDRHAARVTASLLKQVGLDDLVAENIDDYVRAAKDLAADVTRLTDIKRSLRETMRASPLCDGPGHTKEVEDAFREMWRRWCAGADERAQERHDRNWPIAAPRRPMIRILNGLGSPVTLPILKSLGVMKGVYQFTDIHPLGIKIFPIMSEAINWHHLIEEEENRYIKDRDLSFMEAFVRTFRNIEARGGKMLVRPWNHLDFIAAPFLPTPTYELDTNNDLERHFDIQQVFITRHPLAQWSDFLNDTIVGQHIKPSEFLRGYRKYAEAIGDAPFFRSEEFHQDTDRMLRGICEALDIEFDPSYTESWFIYTNITGEAGNRTLQSRMFETFNPPPEALLPGEHIHEIRANEDYHATLELLGYNDDYPIVRAASDTVPGFVPNETNPDGITELAPPAQIE